MTGLWLTNPPCTARQMRNAATLLNLVELSVAVASIPAGLIMKGTQAAGKCAAVLPGKASLVIKTNRSPTHKSVAKAKASALPKALEKCWRPWQVSVLMVVLLSALDAMACVAFVSEDATFFASARGAQPVLHTYATGSPDVISCPSGACLDPLSDMADDQSAAVKKTTLLVGSSLEESASLSEQVTVWLLLHVQLTRHSANLMPDELVDAEHTINAPRTTPRPTTAKVDSNDPNFRNSGGDPRAREVSFAPMERRERPCHQA